MAVVLLLDSFLFVWGFGFVSLVGLVCLFVCLSVCLFVCRRFLLLFFYFVLFCFFLFVWFVFFLGGGGRGISVRVCLLVVCSAC